MKTTTIKVKSIGARRLIKRVAKVKKVQRKKISYFLCGETATRFAFLCRKAGKKAGLKKLSVNQVIEAFMQDANAELASA